MFKQALKLIKKYDRIIIHRHSHPDGDALGSQMGMYHLIKDNFPKKSVYMVGDAATRFPFVEVTFDELKDVVFDPVGQTVFGNKSNAILSYTIVNGAGENVMRNYEVRVQCGTLTVKRK